MLWVRPGAILPHILVLSLAGLLAVGVAGAQRRAAGAQRPASAAKGPTANANPRVEFLRDIQPIFSKNCYGCHGPQQQMNGLRLDDRDSALAGGYSGVAIQPGNSAGSLLFQRVTSTKRGFFMPPVGPRLTPAEVAKLRAWIDQGAVWPEPEAGNATAAARADAAAAQNIHWAFRPIRRPPLPQVQKRAWVRNPIDAFVLARLEQEGIEPSPEAGRTTLIRRLSLDLIGLPPTPYEVAEFLGDTHADAYERLADRLLASPHYGEKWARLWLDLAHYADSDGYEKDQSRAYAWRYRHWLIEALNRGMPFDQLTIAQLAGDLLPNVTDDDRVATGFLRNTLTNREAGVDRAESRFEQLVDRTNTVGTAWLGLTVGCAQCHDHKYDPIKQKDYYQLMAYFNTAEEANVDAPLPGEMGPYLRARPEYDRKRELLLAEACVHDLQAEWERDLRDAIDNPGRRLDWDFQLTSMRAMFDGAEKVLKLERSQRTERQSQELTNYFLYNFGPAISKDQAVVKQLREVREKLAALDTAFPGVSQAQAMTAGEPLKSYLYVRGDYRRKGIEVQPATPSFLPVLPGGSEPARLALARWLVHPANPLTARVAVNRMWQELFGRGLVTTSENFGTQGEKPSHPELLDWLATEFRQRGWSMKQMHRLMVTSASYRQSAKLRPDLQTRDPENRLLARQSRLRLPAELIRDSALAASGLLNPAIGGRSVRPPQPPGVAELAYANSVKWPESKGADRYRRGLYIHFQRTVPYPQLMNFDAPDSMVACSRRRVSNTPLQALNLLNDPVFFEAAQALAARVLREAPPDLSERLDYAFELCLARKPSEREKQRLARYIEQQREMLRSDGKSADALFPVRLEGVEPLDAAAWAGLSRVLLNLDEFITRE